MEDKKSFSGLVIRRFLTGRDYEKFIKEYKVNMRNNGGRTPRTLIPRDLEILARYQAGDSISKICREFGIKNHAVNTSLRIAALSKI